MGDEVARPYWIIPNGVLSINFSSILVRQSFSVTDCDLSWKINKALTSTLGPRKQGQQSLLTPESLSIFPPPPLNKVVLAYHWHELPLVSNFTAPFLSSESPSQGSHHSGLLQKLQEKSIWGREKVENMISSSLNESTRTWIIWSWQNFIPERAWVCD